MPAGRPRYEGPLTPREWEVLNLIEEGLTNEEIAARLGISFAGARYHVAEIISKLGVANRKEAVVWAQEQAKAGVPTKRRWSLWPLLPAPRLGSPFVIAGAGAGLTLFVAVLVILMFTQRDGGTDEVDLPREAAVDGRSVEAFLREVQTMKPLDAGQVLYTRVETYERHGPKSSQIAAANGIPVENYVRESWVEAGPNDTFVRAYSLVTDMSGNPILATVTEGKTSRIYDVQADRLFREDEVPEDMHVIGDPEGRIQGYIEALQTGEIVPVSQTVSEVVVESVLDQAHFEDTIVGRMEERRELTEEEKQSIRDCFFQRCMTEPGSYAVPFYGDLGAVASILRLVIDSDGMVTHQETTIETETGERIVVQSSRVEAAVVDEIPPEVIALTR